MPNVRPSALTLALLLYHMISLSGQTSLAQDQSAYRWRQRAVPLTSDRPTEAPDARGEIVDSIIGLPKGVQLGAPEGANYGSNFSTHPRSMEELPKSSDAVVVATFLTYEVHETPSGRSLYTIAWFKIDDLIRDGVNRLSVGQTIPIMFLGGTAVLPSGATVSIGIPQLEDAILPQRQYLAFLHFNQEGLFFYIEKTWDLSTGKAMPNTEQDRERVRRGTSAVAGTDKQSLIRTLKEESAN